MTTADDLRTAFKFFGEKYPTPLPDGLFARAEREGFNMLGYRLLTDDEKHDYVRRTRGPQYSAVFLPPTLYGVAKAAGHDMTMFVRQHLMSPLITGRFEPSDKPKWPCRGQHKQIKSCSGGGTCMPGKGGKCVACADDD